MNQMDQIQRSVAVSNQRLSTGKRVNSGADSPSDMIRMSQFEAQIRGNDVALGNIQDGISFLQVKDTALDGVQEIGQRLRELSVKYESDTLSAEDKELIESEARELTKEISYLLKDTKFNHNPVFGHSDTFIQAGANSGDGIILSGMKFDSIGTVWEQVEREVISDLYSVDGRDSVGGKFSGEFKLDSREGSDSSTFTFERDGKTYSGELTFSGKSKGEFSVDVDGVMYKGELRLNNGSSKEELVGRNSYKINEVDGERVWSRWGDIAFSHSSKEVNTEVIHVPSDVFLPDIDKLNVKDVLNIDWIDKHVLNPIAAERSRVGVEENRLSSRLDFIGNQNVILTDALSRIEDVDMAKELMNVAKQEMLLNVNLHLFQSNSYQYRQHISQLLQ